MNKHDKNKSKARSAGWLRQCRAKTWDGQRTSKRAVSKRACRGRVGRMTTDKSCGWD